MVLRPFVSKHRPLVDEAVSHPIGNEEGRKNRNRVEKQQADGLPEMTVGLYLHHITDCCLGRATYHDFSTPWWDGPVWNPHECPKFFFFWNLLPAYRGVKLPISRKRSQFD